MRLPVPPCPPHLPACCLPACLQVNPRFEAPTAEMRAVLPKEIPMKQVGVGVGVGVYSPSTKPGPVGFSQHSKD